MEQYQEMKILCDAIDLPKSISDYAKYILKLVYDRDLFKGRKRGGGVVAAAIYMACRWGSVPRSFSEIGALTRISKYEIGQVISIIEKSLRENRTGDYFVSDGKSSAVSVGGDDSTGIGASATSSVSAEYGTANASDLMIRFCNRLHLPAKIHSICIELANRIQERGLLSGKSPLTVAAAGIYCVCSVRGIAKSVKEVADVAGVAEGTVLKACKEIWAEKGALFDAEWSI
jgi:transcription initiation factor TFIIB